MQCCACVRMLVQHPQSGSNVRINVEFILVSCVACNVPLLLVTLKKQNRSIMSDVKHSQMVIKPWQHAMSGAIAGLTSRLIIAPLDLIKIRLQLQPEKKSSILRYDTSAKYSGLWNTFKLIIKEEGLRVRELNLYHQYQHSHHSNHSNSRHYGKEMFLV